MRRLVVIEDGCEPCPAEIHDIISEFGLDFDRGNVLKYLLRNKDRQKDDEKALNYMHQIVFGRWFYPKHSVYGR